MLCSLNDLKKYKEYYENISNGNIAPFDESLVEALKTHKNKEDKSMKSYLSNLLSYHNGSTTYLKSRYLMQFLPSEYKLCDGRLSGFDGNFYHSWIESEDKVYDTYFVGVWPKELYYEVTKPIVSRVVDLEKDDEYLRMKEKTVEIEEERTEFGYVDWYSYMKDNTINTRGFLEPLRLRKFKNE